MGYDGFWPPDCKAVPAGNLTVGDRILLGVEQAEYRIDWYEVSAQADRHRFVFKWTGFGPKPAAMSLSFCLAPDELVSMVIDPGQSARLDYGRPAPLAKGDSSDAQETRSPLGSFLASYARMGLKDGLPRG